MGKGKVCLSGTGKGLKGSRSFEQVLQGLCTVWGIAETTGREQSQQATARPCSEGRDLAPGFEDTVFSCDCLRQQETARVWRISSADCHLLAMPVTQRGCAQL